MFQLLQLQWLERSTRLIIPTGSPWGKGHSVLNHWKDHSLVEETSWIKDSLSITRKVMNRYILWTTRSSKNYLNRCMIKSKINLDMAVERSSLMITNIHSMLIAKEDCIILIGYNIFVIPMFKGCMDTTIIRILWQHNGN